MNSVLAQTYGNLEIILIDDGSLDSSGRLCDVYAEKDARIKVIHKKNAGVSSARNTGIDASAGNYIGFVDSDDWIEPTMFEKLLDLAVTNHVKIAMCGYFMEDGIRRHKSSIQTGILDRDAALDNILQLSGFQGSLWNKLFDARLFREEKACRLDEHIDFCEDLLCVCQAIQSTDQAAFTTEQLYHYLIRSEAVSGLYTKKRLTELEAKKKIIELCPPHLKAKAKADYSISASFLLCKFYKAHARDKDTAAILQKEAKRYLREFNAAGFPVKSRIRMLGVLLYPPLFCPLLNFLKDIKFGLYCRLSSRKANKYRFNGANQ